MFPDVTLLLTYVAQAAHDLVPPDALEPVLKAIANSFVHERSSPESIAVGCVMFCLIYFTVSYLDAVTIPLLKCMRPQYAIT